MLISLKLSSQRVSILGQVFKMSCTKMYHKETKHKLNYMAMWIPSAMYSYTVNMWMW